jgi:hypothetical protein
VGPADVAYGERLIGEVFQRHGDEEQDDEGEAFKKTDEAKAGKRCAHDGCV